MTHSAMQTRAHNRQRTPPVMAELGRSTYCLFTDNNDQLILCVLERDGFRSEYFESTFGIFFCILLKVNDVFRVRRMIISEN